MERYMTILNDLYELTPELEQDFRKNVYPMTLVKSQILQPFDKTNNILYFIEKGLVEYSKRDGSEIFSVGFRCEDEFVNTVLSDSGVDENQEMQIEALEDCILWCFPGDFVEKLYSQMGPFTYHYTRLLEREAVALFGALRCTTPGAGLENYQRLSAKFPYWLKRVPLPYLAAFAQIPQKQLKHLIESPIKLTAETIRRRRT